MGMLAAAIFAGQMLNFPVAGGTSGHLIGAALATILLGPWPAMLVMTSVVVVQALLFQDGGLLALGGNLFNMAVVAVLVSYAVYRLFQPLAREALGSFGRRFHRCLDFHRDRRVGLRAAIVHLRTFAGQSGDPCHGRHPRLDWRR